MKIINAFKEGEDSGYVIYSGKDMILSDKTESR